MSLLSFKNIGFLCLMGCFCISSMAEPAEMKFFKSEAFTLQYLPSWRLKEKPDAIFFLDTLYRSGNGATFEIGRKRVSSDPAPIKSMIENPTKEMTDFMLMEARHRVPDTTLVRHELSALGGFPARLFLWHFTKKNFDQERTYASVTMLCYKDGFLYRVVFESSISDFPACLADVRAMIATFAFK